MKKSAVISTFQMLLSTFPGIPASEQARISAEFQQILYVAHTQPAPRRQLLEILHTSRALESAMDELLISIGIILTREQKSLGKYLNHLSSNNVIGPGKLSARLDATWKAYYQQNVTNVRNDLLHRAGAYPANEQELNTFLHFVYLWLAHVTSLK